jgi:hypothetical protein
VEKEINLFGGDKSKKDGFRNHCKECENKRRKEIKDLPIPIKRKVDNNGERNPMFGKHHSDATKKILSEKTKEFMNSEKGKNIIRSSKKGSDNPMFGKHHSEETKKKIGLKSIGRITYTDEVRKRRSEEMKGEGNPFYGQHHDEDTIKLMSDLKKGTRASLETREKQSKIRTGMKHSDFMKRNMSEQRKGDKNPAWRGGTSFGKYCQKFTKKFKERVRIFFGRVCAECGKTEEENGRCLAVHHVNYDKMLCCNDVEPLFVPLCKSCHTKTNHNRDYWESHFTKLINDKYGGKCYIEKK